MYRKYVYLGSARFPGPNETLHEQHGARVTVYHHVVVKYSYYFYTAIVTCPLHRLLATHINFCKSYIYMVIFLRVGIQRRGHVFDHEVKLE